ALARPPGPETQSLAASGVRVDNKIPSVSPSQPVDEKPSAEKYAAGSSSAGQKTGNQRANPPAKSVADGNPSGAGNLNSSLLPDAGASARTSARGAGELTSAAS